MKIDDFEFEGESLERGKWVGDNFWVSHFNFDNNVTKNFSFPKSIVFHDVTLRDGEQTPGVVLRKNEKVEIARLLDEVGVQRIEAGMPVVSQEDFEAVKEIAHLGLDAKIIAFSRVVKEDIDAAMKCDVEGVICEAPVGIPKLKQFGWDYNTVVKKSFDAVDYAKSHGLWVAFFGVDGTRADPAFLSSLYKKMDQEAHVDSLVVVDTFGCATPESFGKLVSYIKRQVRCTVEVHTHNDFGLGVSVAISGLKNGASVVHTSVNGIGERAGNASFEEVAMCLKYLYGISIDLKLEKIKELSETVERYTGFKLQPNKPVVGSRVFTREAGISIAGWVKYKLGSEAYEPEIVGNKHGVLLGKKSGSHSIEWKMRELGLNPEGKNIESILKEVKNLSLEKKRNVTDEEFISIVNSYS
jgi:isopropylmalate/homocitrate/citramalate synthase